MESKVYRLNENDIIIIKAALKMMFKEVIKLRDQLSLSEFNDLTEKLEKANDKLK